MEEIISRHAKKAKKKIEGEKKFKYRRNTDDTRCVSSIHSNVSRALASVDAHKTKEVGGTRPAESSTTKVNSFRTAVDTSPKHQL